MAQINDQQREFASLYVNSDVAGNGAACAARAGYSEDAARQTAYRLLRHDGVRLEIAKQLREAIGDAAAPALAVVRVILADPRIDAAMMRIKLDAAKTVLDRAGHVAPKAAEPERDPTAKSMSEWTMAELDAFVTESRAKLAAMESARAPEKEPEE